MAADTKSPSVSVIVPVYNAARYMDKCARTLFGQTYRNIEYIFVDDCSLDGSIDIIRSVLGEFPGRQDSCRFIRLDSNSGPSVARNKGLEVSTGEYIHFCDADDWMEPDMIEKMARTASAKDADIVVCDFMLHDNSTSTYWKSPVWTSDKVASMQAYIAFTWTVMWTLLTRRALYADNGINFPEHVDYCEDFYVSVRLLDKADRIENVREALYHYCRINAMSLSRVIDKKRSEDERKMITAIHDWFNQSGAAGGYDRELYWRILKNSQGLILDRKTIRDFKTTYPESHRYILSCPYLNKKIKIMMWLTVHRMGFLTRAIISLRNIKVRLCDSRQSRS